LYNFADETFVIGSYTITYSEEVLLGAVYGNTVIDDPSFHSEFGIINFYDLTINYARSQTYLICISSSAFIQNCTVKIEFFYLRVYYGSFSIYVLDSLFLSILFNFYQLRFDFYWC
jgi:hypothetical protein